jgi:hypothetical protein
MLRDTSTPITGRLGRKGGKVAGSNPAAPIVEEAEKE